MLRLQLRRIESPLACQGRSPATEITMSDDKIIHLEDASARDSSIAQQKQFGEKLLNTLNGLLPEAKAWRVVLYLGIVALFALIGAFIGIFIARIEVMDIQKEVTEYRLNTATRVYDGTGKFLLGEFAEERRVLISYEQIPESFINALISTEDKDFLRHHGVDLFGISRAFWKNFTSMRIVQGGSTISQQLIKNLFLTSEQTFSRKLKEAILALQLEAKYTKEEILSFYCNTIYFGHQRYGIEAASRFYFGHEAKKLTLAESAMLAGIVRAPGIYSPLINSDRAIRRRNHVLDRMVSTGHIDEATASENKIIPLGLKREEKQIFTGDYFLEEVRRKIVRTFGHEKMITAGYRVETTVDLVLQAAAEKALEAGLLELSMRQPMRPVENNIFDGGSEIDQFHHPSWDEPFVKNDFTYAVVESVKRQSATLKIGGTRVNIGTGTQYIPSRMLKSHERNNLSNHLKPGDIIPVQILAVKIIKAPVTENSSETPEHKNDTNQVTKVRIAQEPINEAAIVAIEAQTGKVLAIVGGYDISKNQFNNATQALRQTGSAFKPIVLSAALENNKATLGSTIFDEPTTFKQPHSKELYTPQNYLKTYCGITTVRDTLEHSRNIPTIKLMIHTGVKETIDMAKKMGSSGKLSPVYSLALGSMEMTLINVVEIYTAFPNQGVVVTAHMIERIFDQQGNIIHEHELRPSTAMKQSTAFLVSQVLQGVVERGTAKPAGRLMATYKVPLAGKTGTTDDYTDAWFIGYSPQIVCGVWVGNKNKVTLGDDENGSVAALPIWIKFMEKALQQPAWNAVRSYTIPPNIVAAHIDRRNGLLASAFTPPDQVMVEFFCRGTEPNRETSFEDYENFQTEYAPFLRQGVTIRFDGDNRVIPNQLLNLR